MRVRSNHARKKKAAYILLVTLAFLVVILIVLASTMRCVVSNSTLTARNNQFLASEYAAEAATEKVLGQIEKDYLTGTPGNGAFYAAFIPTNTADWPIQYTYSDVNGISNQIFVHIGNESANLQPLPPPYLGLEALITPVTVQATATPVGQRFTVPATVTQTFDLTSIPVFQFVIFYNMNLEIDPGANMNINGAVFSNEGLWSGSSVLTFSNTVWAVQQVVNGSADPFVNYSGTGPSTYIMRGQPVSGANHVTMPIAGTNDDPAAVEAILQWPPAAYTLGSSAAYTQAGETYMVNQADLIISNSAGGVSTALPSGTNFFVYYQDPNQPLNDNTNNWAHTIVWVTNDFYIVSNVTKHMLVSGFTNSVPAANWTSGGTNYQVWYAGYSFLTNALFYDWREGWNGGSGYGGKGKTVQAVQFDVAKFNLWLANPAVNGGSNYNAICNADKHHSIGGVYIYNSVPMLISVLPAVRIINGAELFDSYGLSIATPMPLYVKGDFNTTDGSGSDAAIMGDVAHSRPASFLADAITVLSSGWADNNYNKNPTPASPDTVNAACLEGIVPSSSSVGTANETQYSGGVENFLRLLESWGTLYYNGSIVVMFPSQYATNRWLETGNYYNAPTRKWSFDVNFTNLV
ncbi:MAG TPA: hypothetical protein VGY56_01615 [Verrucomicrobiae bacterium]|nr:hypothetical protein [Verrucomicrobiae bacterium]